MSTLPRLQLLDTVHGDVTLEQQQAAMIGTAFGNGAASFNTPAATGVIPVGEGGNLAMIVAQPGTTPSATAVDQVMAIYTLPAGALDVAGRVLEIYAGGATAANTNSKTMKIIVGATAPVVGQTVSGGTTIASATIATVAGGGGWALAAQISKYGAKGSNTQQTIHTAAQTGNAVGALAAPSALTINEAAPTTICVTCNAATTATDATFSALQIVGMN